MIWKVHEFKHHADWLRAAAFLLIVPAAVACGGSEEPGMPDRCFIRLVAIAQQYPVLAVGDSLHLTVQLGPPACLPKGVEASDARWHTGDPSVATVDSLSGLLIARDTGETGLTVHFDADRAMQDSTTVAVHAAEKMIELGAEPDLFAAAGLGRMELLRASFDDDGRLWWRPHRHGKTMDERDAIGLALLYAYVRGQHDVVDFLLERDGNWNVTGVNNGTVLHRAAWDGDLAMVKRLVAKGADMNNRDNPFHFPVYTAPLAALALLLPRYAALSLTARFVAVFSATLLAREESDAGRRDL